MRDIVVIAHDLRSTHNVGSLLRTAEGLGIKHLYFTGYTPYPPLEHGDSRLPHISAKLGKQIQKTALGAELLLPWTHFDDVYECVKYLKEQGYHIVALEQTKQSIPLDKYHGSEKIALLLGREVEGIEESLITACDETIEIPMYGKKESFNVVQAAAIAMYSLQLKQ